MAEMRLSNYADAARRYGLRILKAKLFGFRQYEGNADEIVNKLLRKCWNGKYLAASSGHFTEFWIRDFSFAVEGLIAVGMTKQALDSLKFALEKYRQVGAVTTTITRKGSAYDYPSYSSDGLPLLLRSLRILNAPELIEEYGVFLDDHIDYYCEQVFDPKTSLVRQDRHFSGMRDFALRSCSAYDNSMLMLLQSEASLLKLHNPFKGKPIKEAFVKEFWNGHCFYDDISKKPVVSADANVIPFWTNAIESEEMLEKCIKAIRGAGLDKPFPIKYSSSGQSPRMNWTDLIVPNYEGDAIWTNLGLMYIDVVSRHDPSLAREYLEHYANLIEKHRNFLELYDRKGQPFSTLLYKSDEGMLWSSQYVKLTR